MYQDNLDGKSSYYNTVDQSDKQQELAVRLNTLCRVYEQADRVLTGDPVQVHVVANGPAPAWSDGKDIFINQNQIEEFDLDELVQINGLNYHELAHHLYSPRQGTSMMQWVIEQERQSPGFVQACNMLEDQRIETLLTGRYPAIIPYLTKTTVRWLAETPEAAMSNYPAIRGRRYLPLNVRIAFRDMFAFPQLIPVIADIVDEYRLLSFSADYARAQDLIKRFKEEVLDVMGVTNSPMPDPSHTDGGPNGCGNRNPIRKGMPEPRKAQQRDAQRAQGIGQAEPIYTYEKPAPSDEESDSEGGEGSGSSSSADGDPNTNNDSGNGEGTSKTIPDGTMANVNWRTPDQVSSGHGSGHTQSDGGLPANVKQILQDIDNSINNMKEVQQDVKVKQRVIIGGDGKHDEVIKDGKYGAVDVPLSVVGAYRKFARELERLKDEMEPGWEREQPAGRINVQRVIRGCNIDEAFDRWDEGSDGTNIEAVLLIDRSGSMGSNNNDMRASEAAWVIKRAMQHIDAPVTVYSFDDKTELVFGRDSKVSKVQLPFIYGNGGTDPNHALIAAERLLRSSKRKTKIMFIITDGDFDSRKNDEIIQRMNSAGMITVMVMIADEYMQKHLSSRFSDHPERMWHDCSIYGAINTAEGLLPFAKKVVTTAIKAGAYL